MRITQTISLLLSRLQDARVSPKMSDYVFSPLSLVIAVQRNFQSAPALHLNTADLQLGSVVQRCSRKQERTKEKILCLWYRLSTCGLFKYIQLCSIEMLQCKWKKSFFFCCLAFLLTGCQAVALKSSLHLHKPFCGPLTRQFFLFHGAFCRWNRISIFHISCHARSCSF